MRKKYLSLVLCMILSLCVLPGTVSAETPQISVFLNAQRVNFPDQEPVLVSGRTLVPLRAVFEAFGCMVEWSDGVAYTACAMPGRVRLLQITEHGAQITGKDYTMENGKEKSSQFRIDLDVPAQNINGRIMVPLRAVSEALGAEVIWNGITSSVNIFYDKDTIYSLEQQNSFIAEHYIKVQHILLENSETGKNKAEIIINQIQQGVNFEALMYEHNLDGGVVSNPDGYVFSAGEIGDQSFEDAAFALEIGELTDEPVKSEKGYHVIRRVALSEEDYESVRMEAIQKIAMGQQ